MPPHKQHVCRHPVRLPLHATVRSPSACLPSAKRLQGQPALTCLRGYYSTLPILYLTVLYTELYSIRRVLFFARTRRTRWKMIRTRVCTTFQKKRVLASHHSSGAGEIFCMHKRNILLAVLIIPNNHSWLFIGENWRRDTATRSVFCLVGQVSLKTEVHLSL